MLTEFDCFWIVFPSKRKKSKAKAREAWLKAIRKTTPQIIIAAATAYAESEEGRGDFVKMPSEIKTAWQRTLGDVSLSDAKCATDAMSRGDLKEPHGYGRHPSTIRLYSKDLEIGRHKKVRFVDGQPTVSCKECDDMGTISCWSPALMKFVRSESEARYTGSFTCAVPCKCSAGQTIVGRFGGPLYDPEKWCAMKSIATIDNARRDLEAWFADPTRCANYEPGFDAWNNS
jgi:hypothetical protein